MQLYVLLTYVNPTSGLDVNLIFACIPRKSGPEHLLSPAIGRVPLADHTQEINGKKTKNVTPRRLAPRNFAVQAI